MKVGKGFNKSALLKIALVIALVVVIYIITPNYFTFTNILNVFSQGASIGIMAIGMTIVILMGEIDISVGSIMYLSGVLGLLAYTATNNNTLIGVLTTLGVGLACGALNGFGVAFLKIPSMIITLGTLSIFAGSAGLLIPEGGVIMAKEGTWTAIASTKLLGMPSNVYIYIAVFLIFAFVVRGTRYGRMVFALGDNADALRASGINPNKIMIITYSLCGLLCGMASILATSRLGYTLYSHSMGNEVYAIAAVVVGGTSMTGGKSSYWGTFIGAFMVASLDNLLRLTNVNAYIYNTVWGALIIIVVAADAISTIAREKAESRFMKLRRQEESSAS